MDVRSPDNKKAVENPNTIFVAAAAHKDPKLLFHSFGKVIADYQHINQSHTAQ